MKSDLFIKVENVSLDLPVRTQNAGARGGVSLSGRGSKLLRASILKDINLDLRPGDRLGLTGKNGAGKTTLLKVLAGIYPVSSGKVTSNGNIQSLLNISLGMNPEATGLENIMLRGLFMDVPVKIMREKIDEIVSFSELEASINNPLYTYSAGMKARLQLSIALSMEPEILLLDEWLGRGDQEFQEKSSKRLSEFVDTAGIVVLATHSEKLLYRICNKVAFLEGGEITSLNDIDSTARSEVVDGARNRMIRAKAMERRARRLLRQARKKNAS